MAAATSTRSLLRSGWVFILLIALEVALAAVLVTRFIPQDPPADPEAPSLVVTSDADGVVQGTAFIRLENADADGVSILLIGETTQTLAQERSSLTWNSTDVTNGPYELRAQRGDTVLAATTIDVQNARQELGATAAVVGATTALAAGGSAIGSGLASQAALTAAQIGKESLIAVGEDQLAMRTKAKKRRIRSKMAFFLILLLVFVFFAFEELEAYRIEVILAALPIAGGVSAIFVALAIGAEYLLGFASRARTRIRFLGSGAISLAISSVAFRTPFGIPGYVEEVGDEGEGGIAAGETDDDEAPHVEGIRALATMSALVTLLLPFLWVGHRWNFEIAEQGLEIALIALATSALPIKPLPGHDIWTWKRGVSLTYAIGAFVLYFGWALAFMPTSALVWVGAFAGIFYGCVYVWLRARSATPQPAWYPRAVAEAHAMASDLRRIMPAAGRNLAKAIDRTISLIAAAIQRAVAALVAGYVRFEAARRERALRRDLRAAAAERATDLGTIMDQLDGLDDEADFTVIDEDGNATVRRVGDLRDEAIRVKLYAELGKDAPGIVTVVGEDGDRFIDLSE